MTFDGSHWTLNREDPDMFQRFVAEVRPDRIAGFREVGTRERVGHMGYGPMAGEWRDVVQVERRSRVTGI